MGEISRNFMARDKVFYDGHAVAGGRGDERVDRARARSS